MLSINFIKENTLKVKSDLEAKRINSLVVDSVIEINTKRLSLNKTLESLLSRRNKIAEEIGFFSRQKENEKISILKQESVSINKEAELLKADVSKLEEEEETLLLSIPNIFNDIVPDGKDENDNKEIKIWGNIRDFSFSPLSHWDLLESRSHIDLGLSTKISGPRQFLYKKDFSKLYRALCSFLLEHAESFGYSEVTVPDVVRKDSLYTTGQLPKFEEDLYNLSNTDLYLSPTGETQLTNIHSQDILKGSDLPLKYTTMSNCYRKEAGAAGRDTRGLIRLHQFHKVELMAFCKPNDSMSELHKLLNCAEKALEKLELPYRTILLCKGDTSFSSSITYDIEVWLPSYKQYKEISSCSNFSDFQARRGMIRYKDNQEDKAKMVHTINGSSLAIERCLAAIVENYQEEDSTIRIPDVLKKYINKEFI